MTSSLSADSRVVRQEICLQGGKEMTILRSVVLAGLLGLSSQSNAALVALYSFSGNSLDSSGNGNNAVVTGATLTTNRFGNPNSAYSFDGVNDSIDTGLLRQNYSEDFSISAWFQYAGAAGAYYRPIVAGQFGPFFVGKDQFNTNIGVENGNWIPNVATGTNAWDGGWHHIAAVFDASSPGSSLVATVYLDGLPVGTGAYQNAAAAAGKMYIGHEVTNPTVFFLGKIDDVSFYNHALSSAEIQILQSIPEPETWVMLLVGLGLVGYATNRLRRI